MINKIQMMCDTLFLFSSFHRDILHA